MFLSGIYSITNRVTRERYVGSAVNLNKRRSKHFSNLKNKIHPNLNLQEAVNKYGIEYFVFEELEHCERSELLKKEQVWLDLFSAAKKCLYNISPFATGSIGLPKSEETRNKIRDTLRSKGIVPPSRKGVGYGYCKIVCKNGHYKTSSVCKVCMRINMKNFKARHK